MPHKIYYLFSVFYCSKNREANFLGVPFTEGEPPVPISNTAVKPLVVDGTALVTAWESRTALL